MNRRDFLRLSLLVPAALVVSIQEPVEKLWDIHYLEPNPANSPSRVWEEVGRQVMEGYAEGIQAPNRGYGMSKYAGFDKIVWADKPDSVVLKWGDPYLKPKFQIEKIEDIQAKSYHELSPWQQEVLQKLAKVRANAIL